MANKVNYKFTPGQEVFVMQSNKVTKGSIIDVDMNIDRDEGVKIKYTISLGHPKITILSEKFVFATKGALLKSL